MWKKQEDLSEDLGLCQEMLQVNLLDFSAELLCCLLLWSWEAWLISCSNCLVVLRLGKAGKPIQKCLYGGLEPKLPFLVMATFLFNMTDWSIRRGETPAGVRGCSCYSRCPGGPPTSGLSPWLWMRLLFTPAHTPGIQWACVCIHMDLEKLEPDNLLIALSSSSEQPPPHPLTPTPA